MTTAWILIGGKSNNRNVFDPGAGLSVPDTRTLGTMLAVAAGRGARRVNVVGGEPTLRRDLARFVEAASSMGLEVCLTTNARMFSYRSAADAIGQSGLRCAVVQLCGADALVHDAVTGSESFAQTVEGLTNLLAAGVDVSVEVPVCSANVGCLTGVGLLAASLGASSIRFRLVEAGSVERVDIVPDLRTAAAAVTSAVCAIDAIPGGPAAWYADFPCCMVPDLKGREAPGHRVEVSIRLISSSEAPVEGLTPGSDVDGHRCVISVSQGGSPARAMPFPCAACELRGGCSTVEDAIVRTGGSTGIHLPLHSASGVEFTSDGPVDSFIVDGLCPFRDGQPPSGVDTLYLVRGSVTELWRMSAGQAGPSVLMHTKNIRNNIVMASSGAVPTLDPACRDCENLSSCGAVFNLADSGARTWKPSVATISSRGAGSDDFLRWPDFAAGFAAFLERSGGEPVRFEGDAPVITLMDGGGRFQPAAAEPLMLWEAARKSAMCELVDYDLPRGSPAFSLWVKRADRWAQVDRMGTILIIRKCTMNCIICQVQKFYAGIDIMPLPDVVGFLEEFRLLGYTRLDLFGGEPTMRRDLVDLVAFAHRFGFYTDLITNGTLMDDALAAGLRDAGLDLCIVSLDGPTPEIHDRIRRVKDGHEKAVAGIEAVVRAGGMEVNVDTVVLPDNIDHLIDLARQVAALGVTRINMFLCLEGPISSPVPRLLGFDRTRDYYERILPEMRRIGAGHGTSISVGPRLLTAGRPLSEVFRSRMFRNITEGTYNVIYDNPEITCKAPDDEVYISLFGDVFPCTAPQMLESSAKMGNAYKDKLINIVRSDRWAEFRGISGHHDGCRMCWRAHFDLDREGEERVLNL